MDPQDVRHSAACREPRHGPAHERVPRRPSGDRQAAREVAPKGILLIFSRSLNLASTCAQFPAKTRLETLLAAAGSECEPSPVSQQLPGSRTECPGVTPGGDTQIGCVTGGRVNLSRTDCSKEDYRQTVSIKMIFLGNKEDFPI